MPRRGSRTGSLTAFATSVSMTAWGAYFGEWRTVYKELIVGFLVPGAVAALVPSSFFEARFPHGEVWYVVVLQALLAPLLAFLTVIGSMGNGPLAAVLAEHGIVFGAIMAFLYSDFVVPPALKTNARYYGWRFAGYLAFLFAVSAVVAGAVMHVVFAVVGLLPEGGKSVAEMATFAIDYTFWLNLAFLAAAAALLRLHLRGSGAERSTQPGDMTLTQKDRSD